MDKSETRCEEVGADPPSGDAVNEVQGYEVHPTQIQETEHSNYSVIMDDTKENANIVSGNLASSEIGIICEAELMVKNSETQKKVSASDDEQSMLETNESILKIQGKEDNDTSDSSHAWTSNVDCVDTAKNQTHGDRDQAEEATKYSKTDVGSFICESENFPEKSERDTDSKVVFDKSVEFALEGIDESVTKKSEEIKVVPQSEDVKVQQEVKKLQIQETQESDNSSVLDEVTVNSDSVSGSLNLQDSSISVNKHISTGFDSSGNRRKLGSSRRKKGQQNVKELKEDDLENTTGDKTTEIKGASATETKTQEELSLGSNEDILSVKHDGSTILISIPTSPTEVQYSTATNNPKTDLENLINESEANQEDQTQRGVEVKVDFQSEDDVNKVEEGEHQSVKIHETMPSDYLSVIDDSTVNAESSSGNINVQDSSVSVSEEINTSSESSGNRRKLGSSHRKKGHQNVREFKQKDLETTTGGKTDATKEVLATETKAQEDLTPETKEDTLTATHDSSIFSVFTDSSPTEVQNPIATNYPETDLESLINESEDKQEDEYKSGTDIRVGSASSVEVALFEGEKSEIQPKEEVRIDLQSKDVVEVQAEEVQNDYSSVIKDSTENSDIVSGNWTGNEIFNTPQLMMEEEKLQPAEILITQQSDYVLVTDDAMKNSNIVSKSLDTAEMLDASQLMVQSTDDSASQQEVSTSDTERKENIVTHENKGHGVSDSQQIWMKNIEGVDTTQAQTYGDKGQMEVTAHFTETEPGRLITESENLPENQSTSDTDFKVVFDKSLEFMLEAGDKSETHGVEVKVDFHSEDDVNKVEEGEHQSVKTHKIIPSDYLSLSHDSTVNAELASGNGNIQDSSVSVSEEINTNSEPSGNRRKLGSSRRKKGHQNVKEFKQKDLETTTGGKTDETKEALTTETKAQEDLTPETKEDTLTATHDSSIFPIFTDSSPTEVQNPIATNYPETDLESLINESEDKQEDEYKSGTDIRVGSASSVEVALFEGEKSEIQPKEEVRIDLQSEDVVEVQAEEVQNDCSSVIKDSTENSDTLSGNWTGNEIFNTPQLMMEEEKLQPAEILITQQSDYVLVTDDAMKNSNIVSKSLDTAEMLDTSQLMVQSTDDFASQQEVSTSDTERKENIVTHEKDHGVSDSQQIWMKNIEGVDTTQAQTYGDKGQMEVTAHFTETEPGRLITESENLPENQSTSDTDFKVVFDKSLEFMLEAGDKSETHGVEVKVDFHSEDDVNKVEEGEHQSVKTHEIIPSDYLSLSHDFTVNAEPASGNGNVQDSSVSVSEEINTNSEPSGNRRKLGSSRRKKGHQNVKEFKQEELETTTGGKTDATEEALATETKAQEELTPETKEAILTVTHDSSIFSISTASSPSEVLNPTATNYPETDLENLINESENLQQNQNATETDFKVTSDTSAEFTLTEGDKPETQQRQEARMNLKCKDADSRVQEEIQPTQIQETQQNDCSSVDATETFDTVLENLDRSEVFNNHSEDVVNKVQEEEPQPAEILETQQNDYSSVMDNAMKNSNSAFENLDKTQTLDTSQLLVQSTNDLVTQQEVSTSDDKHDILEIRKSKNSENEEHSVSDFKDTDRLDSAIFQIYEDDMKPSAKQSIDQEDEGVLSSAESGRFLQPFNSEANFTSDSQLEDSFVSVDEHISIGFNPSDNRRKLGSSHRKKGQQNVKELKEDLENTTGDKTKEVLSPETKAQEQISPEAEEDILTVTHVSSTFSKSTPSSHTEIQALPATNDPVTELKCLINESENLKENQAKRETDFDVESDKSMKFVLEEANKADREAQVDPHLVDAVKNVQDNSDPTQIQEKVHTDYAFLLDDARKDLNTISGNFDYGETRNTELIVQSTDVSVTQHKVLAPGNKQSMPETNENKDHDVVDSQETWMKNIERIDTTQPLMYDDRDQIEVAAHFTEIDLRRLITDGENLPENQGTNETDFKVVFDKSLEFMLEGGGKSETQQNEEVKLQSEDDVNKIEEDSTKIQETKQRGYLSVMDDATIKFEPVSENLDLQDSSVSVNEDVSTSFEPSGNRRKLGSSRRKKGQQNVKEVKVEDLENTPGDKTTEDRDALVTEIKSQEELCPETKEDIVTLTHDGSIFSVSLSTASTEDQNPTAENYRETVLGNLINESKNQFKSETDFKVGSDSSVEVTLIGVDKSGTQPREDVRTDLQSKDDVNKVQEEEIQPAQIQETQQKDYSSMIENTTKNSTTVSGNLDIQDSSLSVAEDISISIESGGNRRKLGSSRRKKGRQNVEFIDEDMKTTTGDKIVETKGSSAIETANKEELSPETEEDILTVTHNNSTFSVSTPSSSTEIENYTAANNPETDQEHLVDESDNLEENSGETDFKVVSDQAVEAVDESDTHQHADTSVDFQSSDVNEVKDEVIKLTEIQEMWDSPQSVTVAAIENPNIIFDALKNHVENSNNYQPQLMEQSTDESSKCEVSTPNSTQSVYPENSHNLETYSYDSKEPEICDRESTNTALSQVNKLQGKEESTKSNTEDALHEEKEELFSDMEKSRSLENLDLSTNIPFEFKPNQTSERTDEKPDTNVDHRGTKRKMGSSRRIKGKHCIEAPATESHYNPTEEVDGNMIHIPSAATDIVTVEKFDLEKSEDFMLDGTSKYDKLVTVEGSAHIGTLASTVALTTVDMHSSPTADQQPFESNSRGFPDAVIPTVDSLAENKENTRLLTQDGILQANNLISESHVNLENKESPITMETEKSSLGEQTVAEHGVEQEAVSSPGEELLKNEEQNENGKLSEVCEAHCTEDDLDSVCKVSINPAQLQEMHQIDRTSAMETASSLQTLGSEINATFDSQSQGDSQSIKDEAPAAFKSAGSRRKLGSSRRNKGRRQVHESEHEENVEHTEGDELKTAKTTRGQEEVNNLMSAGEIETPGSAMSEDTVEKLQDSDGFLSQNVMDSKTAVISNKDGSPDSNNDTYEKARKTVKEPESQIDLLRGCGTAQTDLMQSAQESDDSAKQNFSRDDISSMQSTAEAVQIQTMETFGKDPPVQEGDTQHTNYVMETVEHVMIQDCNTEVQTSLDVGDPGEEDVGETSEHLTNEAHAAQDINLLELISTAKEDVTTSNESGITSATSACKLQLEITHPDHSENVQMNSTQKRRKMGSTRRSQLNRRREEEMDKDETEESDCKADVSNPDKIEGMNETPLAADMLQNDSAQPLLSGKELQEINETSSVYDEGQKLHSSSFDLQSTESIVIPSGDDLLRVLLPEKSVVHNQKVATPVTFIEVPDIMDVEAREDVSVEPSLLGDFTNTVMQPTSMVLQKDEETPDNLRVMQDQDTNQQKPNDLNESTQSQALEMKNTSSGLHSASRRRKMGSTRRNLGPRTKEEDLHQEMGSEAIKSEVTVGGVMTESVPAKDEKREFQLDTQQKDGDSEQEKEKQFDTVEIGQPSEQAVEEIPVSQLAARQHQQTADNPPSTLNKNDVMSESVGRRRKMGSHRKSRGNQCHEDPNAREGKVPEADAIEESEDHREKSAFLDQISEVEESDTQEPVEHSAPASKKTSVQPSPAEIYVGQKSQTLSLGDPRGADPRSHNYDVVMVGDSSVGKTSFMKRAQSGKFSLDTPASVGLDSLLWTVMIDGKPVVLQIWDTAGQERFHSITRQVFHRAQAFLLMYDITSSESFSAVSYWANCIQESAPENVIVLLLGNKSDCGERKVKTQQGEALAKEYNFNFMECSAATGDNVLQSLETVARMLSERNDTREEATVLHREPQQKRSSSCC
ncbi:uncharacterized protein rab44 [Pholidichthys leucotaenia]